MQCRFCRRASLLVIFDHMFWLCFPGVVRNARERGDSQAVDQLVSQKSLPFAMALFHFMASRILSSCRGQLLLLFALAQHHQEERPPHQPSIT